MNKPFIDAVRNKKTKSPTKVGFSIEKWTKYFLNLETYEPDDVKLYITGNVIYEILSEIRNELRTLYKSVPNITDEKLLIAYFGISNRIRYVLSKKDINEFTDKHSIYGCMLNNNVFQNELTFQEIAESSVDGLNKAIFFCKKRIDDNNKLKTSTKPLDTLQFIEKESALSQLYDTYESYWSLILWGDYDFNRLSKEEKIYSLAQKNTLYERGALSSYIRKDRISTAKGSSSLASMILPIHKNDNYIKISKSKGNIKFLVRKIESSNQDIEHSNAIWRTSEIYLADDFPKEYLDNSNTVGFTIMEALNVLRNLSLLSVQYEALFPADYTYKNVNQLSQFCPKVNKQNILKSLSKSTNYSFTRVSNIMNFIQFDSSGKKDLWCHPVVNIKNRYIILTSSLVTPIVHRIVEKWIYLIFKSMDKKGRTYENYVTHSINDALSKNKIIDDYDKALSKRFKLKCGEEEIDLIFRIGNIIILGEIKSIVSADSHISRYRTYKILEKASSQIKRKSSFFKDNLEEIFERLNWIFKKDSNYTIVKCILNSGRMYVGYTINNTPVIDEIILSKYLSSNKIPCVSDFNPLHSSKPKHLAWYTLYNNFIELQNNLQVYIKTPPQVYFSLDNVELKHQKLPFINKDSYKIIMSRLVYKDKSLKDLLESDDVIPFKLEMTEDIDRYLNNYSIAF